jgi:hypothetical protein
LAGTELNVLGVSVTNGAIAGTGSTTTLLIFCELAKVRLLDALSPGDRMISRESCDHVIFGCVDEVEEDP